jgi:hypothetical protein
MNDRNDKKALEKFQKQYHKLLDKFPGIMVSETVNGDLRAMFVDRVPASREFVSLDRFASQVKQN